MEEVIVDVDPEFQGLIIENMSKRNGDMIELKVNCNIKLFIYIHTYSILRYNYY